MDKRLNICILINDIKIPLWIYKSIENLTASEFACVTLIFRTETAPQTIDQRISKGTGFLIRLFESIDRLVFRGKHYSHLKTDIESLTAVKSVINLNNSAGLIQGTSEKDVLTDLNPDVVLLLGRQLVDNTIIDIPRYGVWTLSIYHNNIQGMPAHGFWEVVKHQPLTDIYLEILSADRSQNDIIYASRESTYHYSVTENRNKIFWRATIVLPRIIEGLYRYGEVYLDQLKERHKSFVPTIGRPTHSGSFLAVLRDLVAHIGYLLRLGIYKVFHTDAFNWQLRTKIIRDSDSGEYDFSAFRTIISPRKLFWADPFIIAEDNHYYVFVEEFIYKTNKAHLSVLKLDGEGQLIRSEKIIERPYHLSYPFVFRIDGIYYMIPETNQNKKIELYKCCEFPYVWKFEKYIMENVSATDTTLFHYENKWWLFTTIDQTGGVSSCSTELFLFYSDDPIIGRWVSHPLNPVVSDESRARCAGELFIENGKIFRPSQDCSMRYGRGLNINHVTKLNEQDYKEVLIMEIKPDFDIGLKGIHTMNRDRNMIIIDTYKFHRRLSL
ncbi:MAG: hypothetical protein AB9888_13405 [Bacteroidales bacterium]